MTLLVLALGACTTPPGKVISMEVHTVEGYPPAEKFPLKVSLRLPQDLRGATWNVHHFGVVPLGMQLAHNAQALAGQLFSHVMVGPEEDFDATLTACLAYSEQVREAAFFLRHRYPHALAIGLEWTLATPKGVVIWTGTARGEASEAAPPTSYERVIRVLDQAFSESFRAMSSAPAIREFSVKKPE